MISGDTNAARHILGRIMGAEPDGVGSTCAVCGESPYPTGRPSAKVFGPNFTDYELCHDAGAEHVCTGCGGTDGDVNGMLGGKPSRTNPPLRMGHVAVFDGPSTVATDIAERYAEDVATRTTGDLTAILSRKIDWFREVLIAVPPELRVLCWTDTAQKHASLYAGICADGVLYIGTETGTVEWLPSEHMPLMRAVEGLRVHARREHIASGQYPPHVIAALGASWEPLEAVVKQHRPSTRLDMVLAILRRPEASEEIEPMPIAEPQRRAAELLLSFTYASGARQADAIRFWSHLLPRRLAAAASRPNLLEAASKLMSGIGTNPRAAATVEAIEAIEALTAEEATNILRLWRTQAPVIIALTRIIRDEEN